MTNNVLIPPFSEGHRLAPFSKCLELPLYVTINLSNHVKLNSFQVDKTYHCIVSPSFSLNTHTKIEKKCNFKKNNVWFVASFLLQLWLKRICQVSDIIEANKQNTKIFTKRWAIYFYCTYNCSVRLCHTNGEN